MPLEKECETMSLVRVMSAADMAYGQWNCRCLFLSLALLGVLTPCCNVVDDDNDGDGNNDDDIGEGVIKPFCNTMKD